MSQPVASGTSAPSGALARLRETLRGIEGDRYARRPVLPFGVGGIDARLADGGLRLDALHEIAGATPSLGDDASATLFTAGIAARAWGPVLWVVKRRDLFAPALDRVGLADERLLHAEAADDAEVLALMEEGLRHRALGAVIGEVRRAAAPALRRVQAAAEGGRTIALLLRRHVREGADTPSAAVTRWRVGCAPDAPVGSGHAMRGRVARARWHVSLGWQADGDPFRVTVGACDETGRLAVRAKAPERCVSDEASAQAA